jgi:hypothetical protein
MYLSVVARRRATTTARSESRNRAYRDPVATLLVHPWLAPIYVDIIREFVYRLRYLIRLCPKAEQNQFHVVPQFMSTLIYSYSRNVLQWAVVHAALARFLRPPSAAKDSVLDYYHRKISKAVQKMMLDAMDNRTLRGMPIVECWWHARLAAYFESKM